MKDSKRPLVILSIIFLLIKAYLVYSVGYYNGAADEHKKHSKTLDSLIVDNDKWWAEFNKKKIEIDDIILFHRMQIIGEEFKNHSEIKK